MADHTPSRALARFRLLDLTRVRAGPTCVRQFADFGADVIKIEAPPGVDPNEGMGGPRDGPLRDRPGFDQIAQGMSGVMSVAGEPGKGPIRTGAAFAHTRRNRERDTRGRPARRRGARRAWLQRSRDLRVACEGRCVRKGR